MSVVVNRSLELTVEHARVLVCWGPAEEELVRRLDQLRLSEAGVRLEVFAGAGPEARLRLVADDGDRLDWVVGLVRAGLGDVVVGEDGTTLEGVVVDLLARQGLRLAVAESFTGGLLGARLSEPPGASAVFCDEAVADVASVEHDVVDVRDDLVIVAEAAVGMAERVARRLDAQVAVALTGVAGLDAMVGRAGGTVCLGSWIEGDGRVAELHLDGDLERIRADAAGHALDHLRHRLLARGRSAGLHL